MRMGFGLIALLAALAIVAVLAKKQMTATGVAVPPAVQGTASTTDATVRVQGQQIQQQVREQVDALMQQPRALPDDAQ